MSTYVIADATKAALLARLHAGCFCESWSAEWIAGLLAQPGTFACLAQDESGFILCRVAADESEILTLAVDAAARRRGIGSALVVAAAREAADRGAGKLFLEVARSNFPARALYGRLGFSELGCRKEYYNTGYGGLEDAMVLGVEIPLIRVGNDG